MLEETATVVKADENHLWVETESRSSCSHCSSSGCSTSTLAKLFGVKRNLLQLDNTLDASLDVKVGQKVVIGISDDLLVRASLWAYLVPLLAMAVATIAGNMAEASEGMQALLALAGLGAGFTLVYRFTHNKSSQQQFKPQLLRLVAQNQAKIEILNFMKKF